MAAESRDHQPGTEPRAVRFPVQTAIRFRTGQGKWLTGNIENVSRSGVLFRSSSRIPTDMELKMGFSLPDAAAPKTEVECVGRVVRVETHQKAFRVAAAFLRYRFRRTGNFDSK